VSLASESTTIKTEALWIRSNVGEKMLLLEKDLKWPEFKVKTLVELKLEVF